MNTKIRCAECDASLRISEKHYGRSVKCPRCGATVKVPKPDLDELDDLNFDDQEAPDFDDEPPRRSSRSSSSRPSKGSKRGKKASKDSSNGLVIAIAAGAGVVVLVVGALFLMSNRGGQTTQMHSGQVASVAAPVPAPAVAPEQAMAGPAVTAPGATIAATPNPATPHLAAANPAAASSATAGPVIELTPQGNAGASINNSLLPATNAAGTVASTDAAGANENLDLSVLTDRVGRGLVLIRIKDSNGQNLGMGSGFLISPDGLVATNFHVMEEGATAEAEFRDGGRVPITGYRAFDQKRDLAIVQLESVPADAVPLELAGNLEVKQGSSVVAMGHPRGLRFTATEGIVSAVHKTSELPPDLRRQMECPDDQVWIQTSATIFSGNSGGPLLSRSGKVVGINSWITRDVNFGFASAIQHLIELKSQVKEAVLGLAEVNRQGRADDTVLSLGELDPKVKAVHEEFQRSLEEFQVRLTTAKSAEEFKRILTSNNPARRDAPRLFNIANENPKTQTAYHALILSLAMLRQYYPESTATSVMQQVTAQLLRDHLEEKSFVTAVMLAGTSDLPAAKNFLTEVISKSSDKDVQGIACFFLARSLIATDKPGPKKEGIRLLERVVNEFSDVVIRSTPIVEEAQRMLFAAQHLSIGSEAPEIIGRDADGNEFKLSDYRGKVVMLDFFANWCPHCTKMYPLERIMVEKQRNKPYVLLGVNCDQEGVLQQLIQEKKVTWQCWVDGEGGPISQEWQLTGFPMIYIIDHEGIIRYQFNGAPDPEVIDRALAQLVGKVGGSKSNSATKKPAGSTRSKNR